VLVASRKRHSLGLLPERTNGDGNSNRKHHERDPALRRDCLRAPMTRLFMKVDLHAGRWMLRQVTHERTPVDVICQMELTAALVGGDLPSWSQRQWADRWKCSTWKVRKMVDAVALHYPHQTVAAGYQTPANGYANTLCECFPHLRSLPPNKDQTKPNKNQTTCALPIIKEEEVEVEVEKQPAAQAPAPVSPPKAKSPKAIEAEQGLACLRTLRAELHQAATGKRHTASWGKGAAGKVLASKVTRLLAECREREIQVEPLACLEALARWVYGAPGADWLRSRSSPLVDALGGNALTRASRVDDALAWVAGGQAKSRPIKSRGKPGQGWLDKLSEKQDGPERHIVNEPTHLLGESNA